MKLKEILPNDIQSVSWTGKSVSYYLHTIDRREMEKYFERNFHMSKKSRTSKVQLFFILMCFAKLIFFIFNPAESQQKDRLNRGLFSKHI